MDLLIYLVAALFLPLFPFSMIFNALYGRMEHRTARMLLLVLWPQIGLFVLNAADPQAPAWIAYWAVLTAALYAFRMLALREVGVWTGFLATSAWALLWLPGAGVGEGATGHWLALGFSLPLALMASLVAALHERFGGAYAGLCGGLASTVPRLAGVLVVVILSVIATPLFPGFFTLLSVVTQTLPVQPVAAVSLVGVWLLWSWAGARLIQGLVVGPVGVDDVADLSPAVVWGYVMALGALVIGGISLVGGVL